MDQLYRYPMAKDGTLGDNVETMNVKFSQSWGGLDGRDDTQHCRIIIQLLAIIMKYKLINYSAPCSCEFNLKLYNAYH